jgi:YfiR/HmsC-like
MSAMACHAPMRLSRIAGLSIVLCILTLAGAPPLHAGRPATHPSASAYALEAAYIFNFIQFTDWPGKEKSAPITVLVTGDDRVRSAMQSIAAASDKSGRIPLRIDPCTDLACLDRPHVLFIGSDQEPHLQQWLGGTKGLPVLTISDIPGFSDRGGMIELVRRRNRLSFRINRQAITDSGLYVSAQLLQLGEIIDGERP